MEKMFSFGIFLVFLTSCGLGLAKSEEPSAATNALPANSKVHPEYSVVWKQENVTIVREAAKINLFVNVESGCKPQIGKDAGNSSKCHDVFVSTIISNISALCNITKDGAESSSLSSLISLPRNLTENIFSAVSVTANIRNMDRTGSLMGSNTLKQLSTFGEIMNKTQTANLEFWASKQNKSEDDILKKFDEIGVAMMRQNRKSSGNMTMYTELFKLFGLEMDDLKMNCSSDAKCPLEMIVPQSCESLHDKNAFNFVFLVPRIWLTETMLSAQKFKIRREEKFNCSKSSKMTPRTTMYCELQYTGPKRVIYSAKNPTCLTPYASDKEEQIIYITNQNSTCHTLESLRRDVAVVCSTSKYTGNPELQVYYDEYGIPYIYCPGGVLEVAGETKEGGVQYHCSNEVFSLLDQDKFEIRLGKVNKTFQAIPKGKSPVNLENIPKDKLQPIYGTEIQKQTTKTCAETEGLSPWTIVIIVGLVFISLLLLCAFTGSRKCTISNC